jgi:hypothetical protein
MWKEGNDILRTKNTKEPYQTLVPYISQLLSLKNNDVEGKESID